MKTEAKKMDPDFLTVDQVAQKLQLSRPTIYKLFADGKLTPLKFGASTRVRVSELEKIR